MRHRRVAGAVGGIGVLLGTLVLGGLISVAANDAAPVTGHQTRIVADDGDNDPGDPCTGEDSDICQPGWKTQ